MLFKTVLLSVLATLTAAESASHLESFLKSHPNPSNVIVGDVTDIDPTVPEKRGMGTAILGNRCYHDIWIWSVDGTGSSAAIKVPARSRHKEPIRTSCDGCGVVLKVSDTPELKSGHHTQFEYAVSGGILYYDISFVDCAKGKSAKNCPGHKDGLAIGSNSKACGKVKCKKGSYCPKQSYYVDQPLIKLGIEEPVYGCGSAGTGMDLHFQMCSSMKPIKRSVAGRLEMDEEDME